MGTGTIASIAWFRASGGNTRTFDTTGCKNALSAPHVALCDLPLVHAAGRGSSHDEPTVHEAQRDADGAVLVSKPRASSCRVPQVLHARHARAPGRLRGGGRQRRSLWRQQRVLAGTSAPPPPRAAALSVCLSACLSMALVRMDRAYTRGNPAKRRSGNRLRGGPTAARSVVCLLVCLFGLRGGRPPYSSRSTTASDHAHHDARLSLSSCIKIQVFRSPRVSRTVASSSCIKNGCVLLVYQERLRPPRVSRTVASQVRFEAEATSGQAVAAARDGQLGRGPPEEEEEEKEKHVMVCYKQFFEKQSEATLRAEACVTGRARPCASPVGETRGLERRGIGGGMGGWEVWRSMLLVHSSQSALLFSLFLFCFVLFCAD